MRMIPLRTGLVLGACVLIASSAIDASSPGHKVKQVKPKPVKTNKKKSKVDPAVVQQDAALMAQLKAAHHLLDQSGVSYGGHRRRAMEQVSFAVVNLEREIHKTGHKPQAHKATPPGAQTADALLGLAQNQLAGVAKQLTGLAPSPLRGKTANHVKTAVAELALALALAKDHAIVHELRAAYKVLDRAQPVYAGHRESAKHQINAAIGDLERELHARGMKGHPVPQHKEPAAVSDLQVKATHHLLVNTLKALSGLPATGWRSSAGGHVKAAVHELNKALAVARDHVLVAELHSVYNLIEKADGIYQGHRAGAMQEILHAVGHLEKEMAVHGLKAHAHKHAWEPVAVSNWHIKQGRGHLQHVQARLALLPATAHRKKADGHVKAAVTQLGLALKVVQNDQK